MQTLRAAAAATTRVQARRCCERCRYRQGSRHESGVSKSPLARHAPAPVAKIWAESSHEACNHWGCPDPTLRHNCCQTRPATAPANSRATPVQTRRKTHSVSSNKSQQQDNSFTSNRSAPQDEHVRRPGPRPLAPEPALHERSSRCRVVRRSCSPRPTTTSSCSATPRRPCLLYPDSPAPRPPARLRKNYCVKSRWRV